MRTKKEKEEKSLGQRLIESIEEAIANPESMTVIRRGFDVKHIRKSLNLTQKQFADSYGFNLETLRKWEQGAHTPEQAIQAYLACIIKRPKLISKLLKPAKSVA